MERDWIELFQWFHKNPELGFEEKKTTEKIREILTKEKIEILNLDLETGLIAVVRGEKEGKKIGYRADIDALPVAEKTDLSYRSVNKNVMHACGHDFHIIVGLAAAIRLNRRKDELHGTIYFIFQPGEEAADGAKKVMETGALKEIDTFYGVHAAPYLPVGTFGVKSGAVTAAVDRFKVTVKGKGTHAATPHLGNSPIPPILQMVSVLQTIIPGKIAALHPAVLTIAQINVGSTWNVIPEEGYFQGTVRSTDEKDREIIRARFEKTVQEISRLYEVEATIDWHAGPSAVVNSEELTEHLKSVLEEEGMEARQIETSMTSDDFSVYPEENHGKGLYIPAGTGEGYPLHHPKFQVDTKAIPVSVQLVEALLLKS